MPKSGKKNRSSDRIGQDSSPDQDKPSNSLKKSRTADDNLMNISNNGTNLIPSDGNFLHFVQNQVTIEAEGSHPDINQFSRLEFISSQINNHYSASNLPFYVVHIGSKKNMGNIGNLHPMKLGKLLANSFSFISNIRRIGKNIISVNFKYRQEVNSFVDSDNYR